MPFESMDIEIKSGIFRAIHSYSFYFPKYVYEILRQAPGPPVFYLNLPHPNPKSKIRHTDFGKKQILTHKNWFKFYGLKTKRLKRTVFVNYGLKHGLNAIVAKHRVPKVLHCYLFGKLGNIIIEGFCGGDVSGRPISGRI